MEKMKKIFLTLGFLLLLFSVSYADHQNISGCTGWLNTTGIWTVNESFVATEDPCLVINNTGITIDGRYFRINGTIDIDGNTFIDWNGDNANGYVFANMTLSNFTRITNAVNTTHFENIIFGDFNTSGSIGIINLFLENAAQINVTNITIRNMNVSQFAISGGVDTNGFCSNLTVNNLILD